MPLSKYGFVSRLAHLMRSPEWNSSIQHYETSATGTGSTVVAISGNIIVTLDLATPVKRLDVQCRL
ncbi:hypothetical protein IQ268_09820 [Oculatella sp. LEGE 06141]|uniref:hypothetical protein n=1 Tax=Oculatella sp. LEGE 06141 TaxID=1828648 RepID=UPI00187F9984|nr:hypothetical protein [Oculatella sp. LEGE 06141]MBE9178856.1 hypothetical protein [Oculatella sp. LEGE 06141]